MRTLWPLALTVAVSTSLAACKSDKHLDVIVTWSETYQTIDGFGAASVFFGGNITEDVADQLFDPKKGIGLSLLRTQIGHPADTDQSTGAEPTDGSANPVATAPELTTAQQALARGAKVWATAWTPPPIWKTTNNMNGSQKDPDAGAVFSSNKLDPSHYQDYADYLADYVDFMAKNGVPLIGLSAANEPDYTATWENAQWSPDELASFIINNLGPTFEKRCRSVKIVAPDTADWPSVDKYITPLLNDPNGKNYLGIVATHPYQNSSAKIDLGYSKPAQNGKPFWQAEWSQENMKGDTPDPTMTSAINMMQKMHDHMVISNMNAWNWWAIYISADSIQKYSTNTRQNPAFIQPDATYGDPYMFKRGYAFGHWSKFVRPGFKRIGATDHPTGGVLIEAYRDESNHLVLTAINANSGPVTQNFLIEGASFGKLTPWVTSPDDSLAAKTPFDGGSSFTFDLPAKSVVTFVNWDATTETPGLTLPPPVDGGVDARPGSSCDNAMVPNNLVPGGVTDFTDWSAASTKWGDPQGLSGYVYPYHGPMQGSATSASVDDTAKALHASGTVMPGDYCGTGLSFLACTTVVSFSALEFTLSGQPLGAGCEMELQVKTFDQQPVNQNPAGGCYQDAGTSCYNFPTLKQVAFPTADPTTVVVPLDSIANWSPENAAQVVGLQWQFTAPGLDPDAGVGCPFDVYITNIRFFSGPVVDAGEPDTLESEAGAMDAPESETGVPDAPELEAGTVD
jgi:glucuronoarabinoxylan endo-1,4-beta-xylanase